VIGGDAVHVLSLVGDAAKKIASTDDDCKLDAQLVNVGKFGRDFMNAFGVDAKP